MSEPKGCLLILTKLLYPPKDKKTEAVKVFPYKRKYLLSKAELSFYKVLDKAIQAELKIITKVRLEDIIVTDKETEEYQKYRNKIRSKHLDFVLCKPDNMYVYAAIELDDSSHEREDRQERDEFVGEALKTAGIPLIRFKCQRSYSENEIRNIIQEAVKGYY